MNDAILDATMSTDVSYRTRLKLTYRLQTGVSSLSRSTTGLAVITHNVEEPYDGAPK